MASFLAREETPHELRCFVCAPLRSTAEQDSTGTAPVPTSQTHLSLLVSLLTQAKLLSDPRSGKRTESTINRPHYSTEYKQV